jgi:hypothetical protein
MDDSVSYTAQQLASGATYYASSNDYNIATGGKLYYDGGSTEAILDETNYNANDTQWVAGLTQSVIQVRRSPAPMHDRARTDSWDADAERISRL